MVVRSVVANVLVASGGQWWWRHGLCAGPTHRLETVASERALDRVPSEVLGRVPSDRDIVVVDDQLDAESLRHGQTRGLGVVALHLRPVGSEAEAHLCVRVCVCVCVCVCVSVSVCVCACVSV